MLVEYGWKGPSDEVAGVNEENVVGQWRKGDACYKVAQFLAESYLRSNALQKVELEVDKVRYLTEGISEHSV